MKKVHILITSLALIAALMVLGLLVFRRSEMSVSAPVKLRLWYVSSGVSTDRLKSIADDYSRSHTDVSITLRSFEDESSLAAALDTERPEMLLCDDALADALSDAGRLCDISGGFSDGVVLYSGMFETGGVSGFGQSFFPLLAVTDVLYVNTGLVEEYSGGTIGSQVYDGYEKLMAFGEVYSDNTGLPYFACYSYYALFRQLMLQNGLSFAGERAVDLQLPEYINAYNTLAECAFHAGVVTEKLDCVSAVENGDIVCAVVSADMIDFESMPDDTAVFPLPVMRGAERIYYGRATGIAITGDDDAQCLKCCDFIRTLVASYKPEELAGGRYLSLIGAQECYGGQTDCRIELQGFIPGYADSAARFDESFLTTLAILN